MISTSSTKKKHLLGVAIASMAVLIASCSGNVQNSSNPEPASNAQQTSNPSNAGQTSNNNQVAVAQARVGQPAPDFTVTDSNGKTQRLSDYKGKTVVLEWTNHECPFVRKHYESGNMQKLQKDATGKGVVWLSVISSAPGQQGNVNGKQANDLTKSRKAEPTAVLLDSDGKVGRLYEARTTPHMYVISSDGKLMYMGAIDSISSNKKEDVSKAKNYISAALAEVLKSQPVSTPVTQPYGCSVKYAS